MPADRNDASGFTVGSLLGVPLGAVPDAPETTASSAVPPLTLRTPPALAPPASALPSPPPGVQEGSGWIVVGGDLHDDGGQARFRVDGVESLTFSNPFGQNVERAWFDGKIVFALDVGEVDVEPSRVKVSQEYQIVYAVELDEQGKLKQPPSMVDGQYNIYAAVPGMSDYSPIWQFNYVVVPEGYTANTLRSAADCERGGYPIVRSQVFEN